MKNRLIFLITLLIIMLVTGVFWGTWFTLTRSIDQFSAGEFIHIGQVIISNIATPMRLLFPGSILLMVVCMFLTYNKERLTFYYFSVALAFMIIALLITLIIEVPIDNQIKAWTVATVPENWHAIRERWAIFHAFRTFSSLFGFIIFAAGTLISGRANRKESIRRSWLN